jgi:tetrapyrrole methylase family protein / MazG family protein
MPNSLSPSASFENLRAIFKALRDPETGCPWDIKQTHGSLLPYLIEEAYEYIEAVEHKPQHMAEELGDVLLQVMLHAQVAEDSSTFSIDDVILSLSEKLIERHPHVFGSVEVADEKEVVQNWQAIKDSKKPQKKSALADLNRSAPALLIAEEVGKKVAKLGFDWSDASEVIDKIDEELLELKNATSIQEIEHEVGDLLFSIAQFARKHGVNPELALQKMILRFQARFESMEQSNGGSVKGLDKLELEALWIEAKKSEGHL